MEKRKKEEKRKKGKKEKREEKRREKGRKEENKSKKERKYSYFVSMCIIGPLYDRKKQEIIKKKSRGGIIFSGWP